MMRKRKIPMLSIVALAGLAAVTGFGLAQTDAAGAAGAEKIVCPQTEELIDRDQCPTIDPNRADCPGRIVCPLTGELVCKDRCPLTKNDATPAKSESETPLCCASKR